MSTEINVAIIGGIFLIGAGLITLAGTRGKTRADAKAALDKLVDDRVTRELTRVYAEIDELRETTVRQASAFSRILRAIAEQWSGDPRGPDLDPADIREVEQTIPPQWIRRRHPTAPVNIDRKDTPS